MKIKSIAAICKKNKNIAIFERYSDDGDILTQYIGDGSAVYPVVGLPQLDKESLLTIFDVPEKDRDNYFVKTLGVPAGISFEDTKEHGLTLCADGFRRLIIRKEKDMATPYKECPHCGAHLDSGEKCECRAEEIEAKNSQKYACGLTEQDVESGWECPLDNPNETVERCEDCAFAKETD